MYQEMIRIILHLYAIVMQLNNKYKRDENILENIVVLCEN